MRADRQPWLAIRGGRRRGRQIRDHVVAGAGFPHHRRVHLRLDPGQREARHVRVPGVEGLLRVRERLVGRGREQRVGFTARDADSADAGPGDCRVECHRRELAGVWRLRPRDDQHRLRAMLAGGHRLVAQVGVARQDGSRLLVGLFREVAEDEHDLVFDVEVRVAVVAEILAVRHDDAVAGEDDRPLHVNVVGKGQGPRRCPDRASPDGVPRGGLQTERDRGSAIARPGRELERHREVGLSGEGPGADSPQLRDDELPGQRFAFGARQSSGEALRGERLHVRPEPGRVRGRMSGRRGRQRERQDDWPMFHRVLPVALSGARAIASSAFS